jgi:hypothetical protein
MHLMILCNVGAFDIVPKGKHETVAIHFQIVDKHDFEAISTFGNGLEGYLRGCKAIETTRSEFIPGHSTKVTCDGVTFSLLKKVLRMMRRRHSHLGLEELGNRRPKSGRPSRVAVGDYAS